MENAVRNKEKKKMEMLIIRFEWKEPTAAE